MQETQQNLVETIAMENSRDVLLILGYEWH
jgi:hypothetical protein